MSLKLSKNFSAKKLDPSYVALDLTYRCGFACPFCFVKNNSLLEKERGELTTAALKKIIASLAGKKRRFYLTGGEPALRKDLPDIVRAVKAGGHRCLITTSGYPLTHTKVKALAAAGADEFVISLHGGQALHDKISGVGGSFARAARAVEYIKAVPGKRPAVTLWCTINRANHAGLSAVYRAMAELGPDSIGFNHMEYVSLRDFRKTGALFKEFPGAKPSFRPSEFLVKGISPLKLSREIAAIKSFSGKPAKFYPDLDLEGMKDWYDPARSFKRSGFCLGQWDALWLSPYGDLLTCQPLAARLGPAAENCLEVYNGKDYAAFRNALVRLGGFFPACARCGREPYQARK